MSPAEGRKKPGSLRVGIRSWPYRILLPAKILMKGSNGLSKFLKQRFLLVSIQSNAFYSSMICFFFMIRKVPHQRRAESWRQHCCLSAGRRYIY